MANDVPLRQNQSNNHITSTWEMHPRFPISIFLSLSHSLCRHPFSLSHALALLATPTLSLRSLCLITCPGSCLSRSSFRPLHGLFPPACLSVCVSLTRLGTLFVGGSLCSEVPPVVLLLFFSMEHVMYLLVCFGHLYTREKRGAWAREREQEEENLKNKKGQGVD